MEWKCVDNELPEHGMILVCSPIYRLTGNKEMVYRVIYYYDLRHIRDVKYWAYIDRPDTNIDMIL